MTGSRYSTGALVVGARGCGALVGGGGLLVVGARV